MPFRDRLEETLRASRPDPLGPPPTTLGDHLRRRRRQLGLLQREAAARMGISLMTFRHWEKDEYRPQAQMWGKVIAFLGYDPNPAGDSIGSQIAAVRRRQGLTKKGLAGLLGMDEGTVASWEEGRTKPTGRWQEAVEAFLAGEPRKVAPPPRGCG